MLACCWLAAVGAGLLKSEEILEGVSRLRLSNDIEFEEETFLALMKEAKEVGYSFCIEPISVISLWMHSLQQFLLCLILQYNLQ